MSARRDEKRKVTRSDGYGLLVHKGLDGSRWHMGVVRTPLGYVSVYAEESISQLSVVLDGYEITRVIEKKTYTSKGLVKVAREFIEELAGRRNGR